MKPALALLFAVASTHAAADLAVSALDAAGNSVTSVVDGNALRLRAALSAPAPRSTDVVFRLDAQETTLASCTVPRGAKGCDTPHVRSLGWYWDDGGKPRAARSLSAEAASERASVSMRVVPRPVVLVHGFMSDHKTWAAYTGSGGFLAPLGLRGFAVGDGHAEGELSSGDIARPAIATKTLSQNSAALARYIAGVKRGTGAEMVDLVAHSMGALVARHYIARGMQGRDVAQLVMLGAPNGGSECSALAAALGVLGPASLELRPDYVRQIFNRAVTRRNGVPFHLLAGDPITEGFKAPCTDVPSDGVVSVESASAVPGSASRLPVLHTDMTRSRDVFARFVLPQLQRGALASARDDALPGAEAAAAQFTQVFTGHVDAGATAEVEVNLDQVAIASFALFDPSRALEVTVRGASGNVIKLNAEDHGLIQVDDPASLVTLGYGFRNPRPGPWRVTLRAPRMGTDFALSARVLGGAVLQARASSATPARAQKVTLHAALEHPDKPLSEVSMRAVVRRPNGKSESFELQGNGAERSAVWQASEPGLHGIDIVASARAEGLRIERSAFLAVDVQP